MDMQEFTGLSQDADGNMVLDARVMVYNAISCPEALTRPPGPRRDVDRVVRELYTAGEFNTACAIHLVSLLRTADRERDAVSALMLLFCRLSGEGAFGARTAEAPRTAFDPERG